MCCVETTFASMASGCQGAPGAFDDARVILRVRRRAGEKYAHDVVRYEPPPVRALVAEMVRKEDGREVGRVSWVGFVAPYLL